MWNFLTTPANYNPFNYVNLFDTGLVNWFFAPKVLETVLEPEGMLDTATQTVKQHPAAAALAAAGLVGGTAGGAYYCMKDSKQVGEIKGQLDKKAPEYKDIIKLLNDRHVAGQVTAWVEKMKGDFLKKSPTDQLAYLTSVKAAADATAKAKPAGVLPSFGMKAENDQIINATLQLVAKGIRPECQVDYVEKISEFLPKICNNPVLKEAYKGMTDHQKLTLWSQTKETLNLLTAGDSAKSVAWLGNLPKEQAKKPAAKPTA